MPESKWWIVVTADISDSDWLYEVPESHVVEGMSATEAVSKAVSGLEQHADFGWFRKVFSVLGPFDKEPNRLSIKEWNA